jgi:enoyl-CoA hydratase/carnithine racemase
VGGDITFWPGAETGYLRSFFERFLTVVNRLERLPIPTIAAVQGFCLGGGFEIALRCDIIIAERSAQFGHPEQTLAVTTLLGGVYRVAERAGRAFAADMAFTSAKVPAEEMQRRGVVNQVVDDGGLRDAVAAYATKMATGPTKAHAAHKALLRIWALGGVQAADEALMDISIPLFDSDDTQRALHSAVDSLAKGVPRPTLDFHNR